MSSIFTSLLKKHRHRIGLFHFVGGLVVGLLVAQLLPSMRTAGRTLRSDAIGGSCQTTSCQKENGWNMVNVFYGDQKHIVDASAISRPYYESVRWYSQARQDEVVAALLRNKRKGYFVDLAANDAVRISNTYAFETFFDWRGLCMEPNPAYWAGLSYRKCDVIGAVIGDERMKEVCFRYPSRAGPQGGIVGDAFDNKWKRDFNVDDYPRYTVTLLEIFERFQTPTVIDYLSLDVEGAEDLVMQGFPFDRYLFNIITLERPSAQMTSLLEKHGYIFYRVLKKNSHDTLFYHKSIESQLDKESADQIDTMKKYSELLVRNTTDVETVPKGVCALNS